MNTRTYHMWQAGAIPGVPGPNRGLWPGGISVCVNEETNEVIATYPLSQHPLDETPLLEAAEEQSAPPKKGAK